MSKFRSKTKKGESEAPETVSRDHAGAVEQADLADDGLEPAQGMTTEPGAREVGVEYSGAPGAEELSELIAHTGGDTAEEEARSEVDAFTGKGEGTGDEDDDGVSFEDRLYQGRPDGGGSSSTSEAGGAGSGGSSDTSHAGGGVGRGASGWQNPLVNPITGEGATNPTGSFADYAESKGAREEGPSGDAGGGPVPGSGRSVAVDGGTLGSGRVGWAPSDEPGYYGGKLETRTVDGANEYRETDTQEDKKAGTTTYGTAYYGDKVPLTTEVTVVNDTNGTIVTTTTGPGTVTTTGTYADGSPIEFKDASAAEKRKAEEARQKAEQARREAEEAKKKADEEAAKKKADEEAAKKKEEEEAAKKKEEENQQPGGRDGDERVPLDEKLNDPLFEQYQRSKNAGGGGDGVTDPSKTDDVTLEGGRSLSQQEVHDEAVGKFGQPAPGEDFAGAPRGGTPQNSLGDVIKPGPDQDLVVGQGHTEDPADAFADKDPVVGMPADDTAEETSDDGGGSFLPPEDLTLADPAPDLPDDVEIGGPTG